MWYRYSEKMAAEFIGVLKKSEAQRTYGTSVCENDDFIELDEIKANELVALFRLTKKFIACYKASSLLEALKYKRELPDNRYTVKVSDYNLIKSLLTPRRLGSPKRVKTGKYTPRPLGISGPARRSR